MDGWFRLALAGGLLMNGCIEVHPDFIEPAASGPTSADEGATAGVGAEDPAGDSSGADATAAATDQGSADGAEGASSGGSSTSAGATASDPSSGPGDTGTDGATVDGTSTDTTGTTNTAGNTGTASGTGGASAGSSTVAVTTGGTGDPTTGGTTTSGGGTTAADQCPGDPTKTEPGACGCGASDDDLDADGLADCVDPCPGDQANTCLQGPPQCTVASTSTWIVGEAGKIWAWDGAQFSLQATPTSEDLHDLWAANGLHAWAVGDGGTILQFDGAQWVVDDAPTTNDLRGVFGLGPNQVWAVGLSGTILYNDGRGWAQVASPVSTDLYGIHASPGDGIFSFTDAYAVGDNAILKLDNDDYSWSDTGQGVGAAVRGVWIVGLTETWLVGHDGYRRKWSGFGSPTSFDAAATQQFEDVWGWGGAGDLWAVSNTDIWRALAETWSIEASPGQGWSAFGAAESDVTLVGQGFAQHHAGAPLAPRTVEGPSGGGYYGVGAGLCECIFDSDSDGTFDCDEECDEDPNKIAPGQCGCGTPDTDTDGDGTADCNESWPDAQPRGYVARPCGFDLDDDGIIGEPIDDCRICDGVTLDPDGDGDDEDMFYVDCDAGTDEASCGTAGMPCATIPYAWASRLDGPMSGTEDIICFRGTCGGLASTEPAAEFQGVPGSVVRPATGNAVRGFEYPDQPAMLVGWDSDADGEYPPYDTDDVAVLDGAGYAAGPGIRLNHTLDHSYVELAHFSARDFGRSGSRAGVVTGFLSLGHVGAHSHVALHDLELAEMNTGARGGHRGAAISFGYATATLSHVAFDNLLIRDSGGTAIALHTAASSDDIEGPLRYANITAQMRAATGEAAHGLWLSTVTEAEVLDSVFELDTLGGGPAADEGAAGILLWPCSQTVDIRNNAFTDFQFAIRVDPDDTVCGSLPAPSSDDIVIDSNQAWVSYGYASPAFVTIASGGDQTLLDLTLSNNTWWSSTPSRGLLDDAGGNSTGVPETGLRALWHNTAYGPIESGYGAINIRSGAGDRPDAYDLRNNLIAGASGGANVFTSYAPGTWTADGNVYDPSLAWVWNGANAPTLADWQSASAQDSAASSCDPVFVQATGGDLHLHSSDACAAGAGVAAVPISTDVDGEPRSFSPDAGADERP